MKKDDYWFFSLATFLTLGVLQKWPVWLRVAVVANALVVFAECVQTVVEGVRHGQ